MSSSWRRRVRRNIDDLLGRVLFGPPPKSYANEEEFAGPLEDCAGDPICVLAFGGSEAYLIDQTEDGDVFYVGIPRAEDEEGKSIDKNSGWLRDLPEIAWPLTLVTPYTAQQKRWRRTRLMYAARSKRRTPEGVQ